MEQKEFVWKDMSLQEKNLFAAMYGQVFVGDSVFEAGVCDLRFVSPGGNDSELPWDASASVMEDGRLALEGMSESNGGGHYMAVRLPLDTRVFMSVWDHPPRKPDVPDLVKIHVELRRRITMMQQEVRTASPPDQQQIVMDHGVCEVLSELSDEIIRKNIDVGEWDDDDSLGAMIALVFVVDAIANQKWSEMIMNFTIPLGD